MRRTSTVASIRRVRRAGNRKPWKARIDEVEARNLRHHIELDQAVIHDLRRESEPNDRIPCIRRKCPPYCRPLRHPSSERQESGSHHQRGRSPITVRRDDRRLGQQVSVARLLLCIEESSRSSVPKSVSTVRYRVALGNVDRTGGWVEVRVVAQASTTNPHVLVPVDR